VSQRPLNLFASAQKSGEGWMIELSVAAPPSETWQIQSSEITPRFERMQDRWVARWAVEAPRWSSRKPFALTLRSVDRTIEATVEIPAQDPSAVRVNLPVVTPIEPKAQLRGAWMAIFLLVGGSKALYEAFHHPSPPGMDWVLGSMGAVLLLIPMIALGLQVRAWIKPKGR
jgi:hypothetical protein